MTEEDLCPNTDSNGVRTYFVVPNYSLESALADVVRAEGRYEERTRRMRTEDVILMREATVDPGGVVAHVHGMRRVNALLTAKNAELRERLVLEEATRSVMAARASRLQRDIEKMARRLERLEKRARSSSTSGVRGRPLGIIIQYLVIFVRERIIVNNNKCDILTGLRLQV